MNGLKLIKDVTEDCPPPGSIGIRRLKYNNVLLFFCFQIVHKILDNNVEVKASMLLITFCIRSRFIFPLYKVS